MNSTKNWINQSITSIDYVLYQCLQKNVKSFLNTRWVRFPNLLYQYFPIKEKRQKLTKYSGCSNIYVIWHLFCSKFDRMSMMPYKITAIDTPEKRTFASGAIFSWEMIILSIDISNGSYNWEFFYFNNYLYW